MVVARQRPILTPTFCNQIVTFAARINGPFQASWIVANHSASCRGYANIMAALLRRLGIPAQTQFG